MGGDDVVEARENIISRERVIPAQLEEMRSDVWVSIMISVVPRVCEGGDVKPAH